MTWTKTVNDGLWESVQWWYRNLAEFNYRVGTPAPLEGGPGTGFPAA